MFNILPTGTTSQWTTCWLLAWASEWIRSFTQVNMVVLSLTAALTYSCSPTKVMHNTTVLYYDWQLHLAFRALRRTFMNMCAKTSLRGICDVPAGQTLFDGFCYAMSSSDLSKFPPMSVVLQVRTFDWIITIEYAHVLYRVYSQPITRVQWSWRWLHPVTWQRRMDLDNTVSAS